MDSRSSPGLRHGPNEFHRCPCFLIFASRSASNRSVGDNASPALRGAEHHRPIAATKFFRLQQFMDRHEVAELLDIFSPSTCRKPLCIQYVGHHRLCRWRSAIARSRSRGAGTSDRCRRRGCRSVAEECFPPSPSIRCASRAAGPDAAGRRPRRLAGLRRLPQDEVPRVASCAPPRRGRRPPSRRATGSKAARSPASKLTSNST